MNSSGNTTTTPQWFEQMAQEAWKEAQNVIKQRQNYEKLRPFADNPVGFGEQILGEKYTQDVIKVMDSVLHNRVTIARSANAVGKCVYAEERVLLADGRYVRAADLVGTFFGVVSYREADGKQEPVLAHAEYNGVKPVYRITTASGRQIMRTGNHPLFAAHVVKLSGNQQYSVLRPEPVGWVQLSNLCVDDAVAVPEKIHTFSAPARQDDNEIKLLAYLLGDGGTTVRVDFSQKDGPIKEEFKSIVQKIGCKIVESSPYTLRIVGGSPTSFETGSNVVINLVRKWGLYGKKSSEKSFPDLVWQLDDRQLALFLNRLFSCDGWAYARRKTAQIGITLASESMIMDIQMAMLRLGIPGRVRHRLMGIQGTDKKYHAWEWSIHATREILKFSEIVGIFGKEQNVQACAQMVMDRNFSRVKWLHENIPDGYRWERIKEIQYIGDLPTVTISVHSNEHTFLTTFVEHNSHAAARIAVWFYKVFEGSQIYITAAPPLENLRRILWGHILYIYNNHPDMFSGDRLRSLSIYRDSRSYITGVAIPTSGTPEQRESKFSGKHAPHLLFIVDEGDAVPDEVYKGIESCMSGEHDRLLIMFNPRATIGPVYQKEMLKQANVVELSALNHPNVITGKNIIPGAVTRETTLRRVNQWTDPILPGETPSGESTFVQLPEFLLGQEVEALDGKIFPAIDNPWRRIKDPAFSYMVLGRYPAQADNQLISSDWIMAAVERGKEYSGPPPGVRPIIGLDVAEINVDYNVACLRYGSYIAPLIYWRSMDPDMTATKALDMYREKNATIIMVDGTGVGAGVAPAISRRGRHDPDPARAVSVKVASKPSGAIKAEQGEFYMLRDQIWWAVREWLRTDPNAVLPNDRLLIEELKTPTYNVKETGKIKVTGKDALRALLRRSPDRADALCLAFTPIQRAKVLHLM